MRSAHDPLITLQDYARIHSVIRAVLDGADAKTSNACVFFAWAGAYLLEKHHKISAMPRAGAAFYCVEGESNPTVLSFARFEGAEIVSDEQSFHSWVECDGWAIDFMTPIFHENARQLGLSLRVPRRMFQRRLSTMKESADAFRMPGDFLLLPNLVFARELFGRAAKRPETGDLADLCRAWYRPSPKRMDTMIGMRCSDGTQKLLHLALPNLDGAW